MLLLVLNTKMSINFYETIFLYEKEWSGCVLPLLQLCSAWSEKTILYLMQMILCVCIKCWDCVAELRYEAVYFNLLIFV